MELLVRTFNTGVSALLKNPWTGPWIGKGITTVSYAGRLSGRTFSTPVAYRRDGNQVTILVDLPDAKNWWRNFTDDGGPVTLRLRRRLPDRPCRRPPDRVRLGDRHRHARSTYRGVTLRRGGAVGCPQIRRVPSGKSWLSEPGRLGRRPLARRAAWSPARPASGSPLLGAWQANAQINMFCAGISSKSGQPGPRMTPDICAPHVGPAGTVRDGSRSAASSGRSRHGERPGARVSMAETLIGGHASNRSSP